MDNYLKFFEEYVDKYDLTIEAIKLKYEHTFRVMKNCESIAKYLNLDDKDIRIAKIIGLFHDIGRFYQYSNYGNYRDYENIDHALYSVKILKEEKVIDNEKEKDLVLKAINNHNKVSISDDLDDREILFCKIIRDADKLDIFDLIILDKIKIVDIKGNYNENAINEIIDGKSLVLKDYSEKIDKSLGYLGMINDLNFDYSKIYVKKILHNIIDVYKNKNEIEIENLEKIEKNLYERLGN